MQKQIVIVFKAKNFARTILKRDIGRDIISNSVPLSLKSLKIAIEKIAAKSEPEYNMNICGLITTLVHKKKGSVFKMFGTITKKTIKKIIKSNPIKKDVFFLSEHFKRK
ncbi:MAG: hypothetical protein LBD05_01690 [Mycoplasmataceae bacterium]|jgi:hypothetical protein|nr:hypothetical protein [Mycoplasmataceae bacterium]